MLGPAPTQPGFERAETLDLIRFRAPALHVYAVPIAHGEQPTTVGAARDFLRAHGQDPTGLLNGAMFVNCGDGRRAHETEAQYYARTTCERIGYRTLDRANGVDLPATAGHESWGATISVVAGRFSAMVGAREAPGATVAIQGYTSLVQLGRSVATNTGTNAEVNWRAAIAMLSADEGAFVIGRATMQDFAAKLIRLGALWAVYGDGGSSTRLVDSRGMWKGSSENRRVPVVYYASGTPAPAIEVHDAHGNPVATGPADGGISSGKKFAIGAAIVGAAAIGAKAVFGK